MPGGPTPDAPVGGPAEGPRILALPKLTCRGKSVRIHGTFRRAGTTMAPAPKKTFHTPSDADIKPGEVSHVYFQRTVEIRTARRAPKNVTAEVQLKSLTEDGHGAVLARIESRARL